MSNATKLERTLQVRRCRSRHRGEAGLLSRWSFGLLTLSFLTMAIWPLAASVDDSGSKTKSHIAVLQSDASSFFEKARACQQLGESGTAEAVPVLAALLSDPKLSAYARSGLESIPDPSAAAALRDAATRLKGSLLAGVVNSLGVLRDAKAVDLLVRLASDPASGVVKEALLSLGNIGTPESIAPIEQVLKKGSEAELPEAAGAALLAADRQRAEGNLERAAVLYDLIRKGKVPTACVVGATRGAILARSKDRMAFLMEQLRSGEPAIRNAALLTIREIPDDTLADALNREARSAPAELQVPMLLAVADCHNAASIPIVAGLSKSPNPEVRKTALAVLGRLGPDAALAMVAVLQADPPAEQKAIVLAGLRGLEGAAVDDVFIRALVSATTPSVRIDLIRVLDGRGVSMAAPEILKQAMAADRSVSVAALSALRDLAGSEELPRLIVLAKSDADPAVSQAAENALAGICSRSGEQASDAVLKELNHATSSGERNCWIRVLGQAGYPQALPAIEAATSDPDPKVAENAIVQLGHWSDSTPIQALLRIMDSSSTPELRKRAIVAVLDLAATAAEDGRVPEVTVCTWVQRVNAVADSVEDKRRMLGVLGRLKTSDSFALLSPYLEDATLRTEAASGIIQIAPALVKGEKAAELKAALEKIASTVNNADLKDQSRKLAATIALPGPPVSLFDGKSLSGWEGDTKVWRVRDGLIVGGSLEGNPRNEFLATVRSYTNFLLRLEYKLVGTEGFVNSGVQFRSVRMTKPANEMNGYQADIGAGYSGCLYDESRRNKFLASANRETIQRLEKANEWNEYEIRAEGRRIQIRLNGELTIDYTEADESLPQWGLIGLQIHGGNKAEVSFRNITIREL